MQTLSGWNPDLQGHDFHIPPEEPHTGTVGEALRCPAREAGAFVCTAGARLSSSYMSQGWCICVFLQEHIDRLVKRRNSRGCGRVGGIAEGERVGPKQRM